ncbi:NADPH-dependent FMN reductase-domain-containing protein [Leucosporidium creatinivorum]|uniref:NADPH-dependent FMN reductase-domain-containing protein n=1 Tax=Leucosporidium creatinivorum TaxID=106004 RepID=A0A1Y2G1D4_9BASI|nr:NADPH-dependent FMN reductase-domain-containing protein [Leucosporidium creatinivorum]
MKLGIILGSTRVKSNTAGVVAHVVTLLSSHPDFDTLELEIINLATSSGHPLPLLIEDTLPQAHSPSSLPSVYSDPLIRSWSSTVLSWDGVLIISPQYNWGVPAPLKNALDHLFHEWVAKPVGLITLGGRGGTKVEASLRSILGGGLDMRVAEKGVQVAMPREWIAGSEVLKGGEETLQRYDEAILECVREIVNLVKCKDEASPRTSPECMPLQE